jgi:hypothetical protein
MTELRVEPLSERTTAQRHAAWYARIPVELLLLLPFGALWCFGIALGLPVNLPDAPGLSMVEKHYFGPILVAAFIQLLVLRIARRNVGSFDGRGAALLLLLTVCSVFLHMNFKAWMPLVHPRLYDAELLQTDRALGSFVSDVIFLRRTLSRVMFMSWRVNIDPLYHSLFVAMFFISASAHALFDTPNGLRRLVVGMCAILLLGGVCYWIVPARGPFVFRPSVSYAAANAQEFMLRSFDELLRTHRVAAGAFAAPLAAMPSLHTAHTIFFVWFAAERIRRLLWFYVPALVFILFEAVATGWHYVIDLPAGALLAFVVIWGVRRALPESPSPRTAGAYSSTQLS